MKAAMDSTGVALAEKHLNELMSDLRGAHKATVAALALVDLLDYQAKRGFAGSCIFNEEGGHRILKAVLTEVAGSIAGAEQEASEVEGALSPIPSEAANGL